MPSKKSKRKKQSIKRPAFKKVEIVKDCWTFVTEYNYDRKTYPNHIGPYELLLTQGLLPKGSIFEAHEITAPFLGKYTVFMCPPNCKGFPIKVSTKYIISCEIDEDCMRELN